jgi:hypothetical protein
MKKLSLILTGVILFGGLSFASPLVKQDKAKTEKKSDKKAVKKTDKKVVKKDDKKVAK